jgi:hypothetical protein
LEKEYRRIHVTTQKEVFRSDETRISAAVPSKTQCKTRGSKCNSSPASISGRRKWIMAMSENFMLKASGKKEPKCSSSFSNLQ